jgi:aminoglycoside 3-N-acetyltransferase I
MSAPLVLNVQRLGPHQIARFRQLMQVFADAFEDPDHYTAQPPDDAYLRAMLAKPDFIALAALKADEVIGGAVCYVLHKFEQRRKEVYIYDLAVAQAHRRQGVATAILTEVNAQARLEGADLSYVQADVEDIEAASLYSKTGERAEVLHFTFDLET